MITNFVTSVRLALLGWMYRSKAKNREMVRLQNLVVKIHKDANSNIHTFHALLANHNENKVQGIY